MHPRWRVSRCVLLEEELRVDTVWVALHGQRLVGEVGEQHGCDFGVVVDDLVFGEFGFRVQRLV